MESLYAYTEEPRLVPLQSGVGLAYGDFRNAGILKWTTLDSSGAVVSGPTTISPQLTVFAAHEVTASGLGAVLLAPSPSNSLNAVFIDAGGTSLSPPIVIAMYPYGFTFRASAQQDRVVVAWIESAGSFGGATVNLATLSQSQTVP